MIPAAGTLLENKDTDKGAGIVPMAAKELISKDVECEDQISQVPHWGPQQTQAVGEALAILAKKTNVVDPKKEPALKKKATGR